MRTGALASLATALVFATATAAAAEVYKFVDANGRMVYTDDPRSARGTAEKVDLSQLSVVPAAPAATRPSTQLVEAADRRAAALDQARSDMVNASRALERAEEVRELGIEPLEGERIGRRFRDEYWQRQAFLENQVRTAQSQLDNAIMRRNQLR